MPEVVGTHEDHTIKVRMKGGSVTGVDLQPKGRRLDDVTLGEQLNEIQAV